MTNHFHMLVVVEDPSDVSSFIGYIKGEIAQAVNKMLGRRQQHLWARGYDSPTILTADDVLRYIAYTCANPAAADLTDTIDQYPGVSSWPMFANDIGMKGCKHISRDAITELPSPALSINEQKRLTGQLLDGPGTKETFCLEPFAWMNCFPEYEGASKEKIKQKIVEMVRSSESVARAKREEKKKGVVGATALRRQSMLKEHTPEKFSRKMICICSDKELRKRFIDYFHTLSYKAAQIYEWWKKGATELRMPVGMFAPREPAYACELIRVT